ncbi:MAG: hypothetical protein Kow0081_1540 [Candidatus Dojkabacteria bacterium]
MIVPDYLRLKNTIKFPTTLIIGGASRLGIEIADTLVKQGGYVILVDTVTEENLAKLDQFGADAMISFLDYTAIPHLEEDVRRLDYVFYFSHESIDFRNEVSTQEFLTFSNYLDATLTLATKFDAKFLLTTSIKAQQLLYSSSPFYNKQFGSSFTQVYTDMEVQRYAEGLVMEYCEKVSLDARVVRLGEIIGDGMDFAVKSTFNKLILQAAREENLVLNNDGLEQEWFVHVLDAAYGLIKAQFLNDTKGNYYSLCYDNTYTHLSIAYKIQEIDENAKEIRFIDTGDNSPPITIQKPAPNLSKIGWMPRISFDKAVAEALAAAKLFIAEHRLNNIVEQDFDKEEKKDLSSKIKGFLNLARAEGDKNYTYEKVIQKKEQNEADKKKQIYNAGKIIQLQKRKRRKSIGEKFVSAFWGIVIWLSGFFSVFRRRSPVEIGIILFFLTAGLFIYFVLVVPTLIVGRNALVAIPAADKVFREIEDGDLNAAFNNSQKTTNSVAEINSTIERFNSLANIIGADSAYLELKNILVIYDDYFSGVNSILESYEKLNQYYSVMENNLQRRLGTETYLTTLNSGSNLSSNLQEIENTIPFLLDGIEKALMAIDTLQTVDTSAIPAFLRTKITSINTEIINSREFIENAKYLKYLPTLLGLNSQKTYAIIALDSSRPAPIGGAITSVATLTFQNGSISQAELVSADQINFENLSEAQKAEILGQINNKRFTYASSVTIDALSTIGDDKEFFDAFATLWNLETGRNIDGIIFFDLQSIENFINYSQNILPEAIASTDFSIGSILKSINLALGANSTIPQRNNVISELLSYTIFNIINYSKMNYSEVERLLSSSIATGDIRYYFGSEDSLFILNNSNTNNIFSSFVWAPDLKLTTNERFPNSSLVVETLVDSSYKLINKVTFQFPDLGTTQEVSICLPENTAIGTIRSEGIPETRIATNSFEDSLCITAQAAGETSFTLYWETLSLIDPSNQSAIIPISIPSVPGSSTRLDYSLTFDSVFDSIDITNDIPLANNRAIFSNQINKSFDIVVSLEK